MKPGVNNTIGLHYERLITRTCSQALSMNRRRGNKERRVMKVRIIKTDEIITCTMWQLRRRLSRTKRIKAKFHYAILVADRFEAGRRHVRLSWSQTY